jgi:hypothetical protein
MMATQQTDIPNLYQRMLAVMGEIGSLRPTGGDQFRNPAISIEDVENALREALVKHRLVTLSDALPGSLERYEEETKNGKQTLWAQTVLVTFINPDKPEERETVHSIDIGGNPSAAVSFALKRCYKAHFHIGEAEDEGGQTGRVHHANGKASGSNFVDQRKPTKADMDTLEGVYGELAELRGDDHWGKALRAGCNELGIQVKGTADLTKPMVQELLKWGKTQSELLRNNQGAPVAEENAPTTMQF